MNGRLYIAGWDVVAHIRDERSFLVNLDQPVFTVLSLSPDIQLQSRCMSSGGCHGLEAVERDIEDNAEC